MNFVSRPPGVSSSPALPHRAAIATTCLSGTLDEKLACIAAAGFTGVELFEADVLHYPGTREEVRAMCAKLGLKIEAYGPFLGFEGGEEVRRRLEMLEGMLGRMMELGVDVLIMGSNASPVCVGDKTRLVEDLKLAAEVAERWGVRIAYEAVSWGTHVNTWEAAWLLVKEVGHMNLGICLDTFHVFARGDHSRIEKLAEVTAGKIFFVQLADAPRVKMELMTYSRHHRRFPAQGGFPIVEFVRALAEMGYQGPLALEVFNDEFRAAPARGVACDGFRSLVFLLEEVYKGILPPLPEVEGIEYVEFAVDEARVRLLGEFLRDMGLRRVARHRSRNVELFSRGGVSFVVNAEPESLASAFLLLHDTSVCAMAVRVKDVQAALNRAASLGCPVVPRAKLGVVDERVVAIQTPDEALMYLVDSTEAWKKDFVFEEERQNGYLSSQTTYNAVDHIAQALDRLSMDRFVLFYKSVLGMHPQQTVELQDLYGLTRSRAMVTPNHALRFPLNISDGKDTSIGQLVSEAAGSIVHHIAFHTDDIFETVLELRRNCSQDRFLRVPQSYYDDLRVRHGLASEFISKMRSYNIMYDRDAKGEFLHLSTEQFANRYFFEIVQRIDGYEHFASANAPIRMSIHHERRNLGIDTCSALSPQTTGPSGLPGADRDLIVVFEPGCEVVVDLVADILGKDSSLDPTSTAGVIGIPITFALQWLVDVDKTRYIIVNIHCIENSPLEAVEAVSKLCQHEFLFSKAEQCRRDLTRVLSFILGQTKPHEAIIRKVRSTFITLTFPDIRTALANLDILTVGADAIELRVDLLREGSGNGSDNPVPSLDYVAKQVMWLRQRTELPIIFTLRSQMEGGRCPSSNEDIAKYFLLKGLKWGCEYIDVEVQLPEETRKYLAAHKGHSKIMASFHDMAGNLKWLSSDTQKLYHTARAYGDVIKIFGFATSFSQNYELEHFRSSMSRSFSHPFIAMNAGQVGQLSRILNHFFTPTTHPLLPMAAAPGQLSAAEINSALHIMGQVSKRTVFTIGSSRAIPPRMFWEKCFNELGLPHQYASIDRISENMIQQLTRQLSFGGAIIRPPLAARSGFISSFTEEARESGVVDTISVRTVGNQSVIVGDNSTAKSLRSLLIRDFAPSAYVGQPVLVVSSSVEDAASALWALRSLHCGEVYTIGFRVPDGSGTQCNNFEEVRRLRSPFVVVNALKGERGAIVKPLLRMVEGHPVPRRGDGVLVDLAGAGMGGGNGRWKVVEAEEVREGMLVEALEALVGQRVGGNFVGMAGGWGA